MLGEFVFVREGNMPGLLDVEEMAGATISAKGYGRE